MVHDINTILADYEDAASSPDGTRLQDWMARYPEFARELAEYAACRFVFEHGEPYALDEAAEDRRLLYAAQVVRERMMAEGPYAVKQPPLASIFKRAEANGLRPPDLARRLEVGLPLITKLERRLIDPATIPLRLAALLAEMLQTTQEAVTTYLRQPPGLSAAASYKSAQAPRIVSQQSFLQALAGCPDMTESQREAWRAEPPGLPAGEE